MGKHGFTLIELLAVTAIIGVLSVAGFGAYELVRAGARDGKRVSDAKQVQTAIEFYFENHSSYPVDGVPGSEGQVLGVEGTGALSDAGFSEVSVGTVFMSAVPRNPEPGGTPYIYRSLYRDGRDCDFAPCSAYAIIFDLERGAGSYSRGPHAITPEGVAGEGAGFAGAGIVEDGGIIVGMQETVSRYARGSAEVVAGAIDDPRAETAAAAASPAAAVLSVITAAAAANSAAIGIGQLFILAVQPLFLARRRRHHMTWGVVYNSLSKLPVDLATVRLYDAVSGRLMRTFVTDRNGRYVFLVDKGKYRMTVAKAGYSFPTAVMHDVHDDGHHKDVYHGEDIFLSDGGSISKNIPADPQVADMSDAEALKKAVHKRDWRRSVAAIGPAVGLLAFVIRPTPLSAALLGAQILAYIFFMRFRTGAHPKHWGTVFDETSERPIEKAVVRIFALPYKKLLETQVTDREGRYSFLVGDGKYFITVTGEGYYKTETDPIDFSMTTHATAIASDIPLRPTTVPAAPLQ